MQFPGAFNELIVLFLVIIVGYISAKRGLFDDIANKKVSKFVINVTLPALILSSVMGDTDLGSSRELIQAVELAIGYYAAIILLSLPLVKLLRIKDNIGIFQFMVIFSNIAFIGFPVVKSMYGEAAIFYASIFNLPFNLLLFTLGIALIKRDHREKHAREKLKLMKILNPGVAAGLFAMLIFLFKLKFPTFIVDSVKMVGNITTPMSLIIIGASLATIPIREVFKDKRLYFFSFVKLIILPVLLLLLLKPLITNDMILGVAVILAGMPVASISVMLCNEYDGNSELATKATFITTLFSVITIPVLTFLMYTL